MIARQHTEATRVSGIGGVHAVLCAQVGDGTGQHIAVLLVVPRVVGRHVGIEASDCFRKQVVENLALGQRFPCELVDRPQNLYRVAIALPQHRIELSPELIRRAIPGPPQVVGEIVETTEPFGYPEFTSADNRYVDAQSVPLDWVSQVVTIVRSVLCRPNKLRSIVPGYDSASAQH